MIDKKPIFDQDSDRKGISFPNVFPITLSHAELPCSHKMMEESGMAFGCIVTPFIADDSLNRKEAQRNYGNASRVARCSHCSGYLNPYCDANNQRWFCSLCGQRNTFQRSQTRYRQVDMKLLPETQDVLVDYRMPIVDSVSDPQASGAIQYNSVPSDLRPLVHVFLIQESMKIDSLQSVIDSLSQTVPTMHPDIKIVLLTFSNRIGIYNFSAESSVPSVQYVHFTAASSETGETTVLEGHDMHEITPEYEISAMMPLSTVANFHATAARIGSCSEAFTAAMTSLFDAYPAETPFSNNDDLLPKMMLGPVLEALGDWILDPPSQVDTDDSTGLVVTDEDDFHATGLDEPRSYGSTLQDGIAQLFSKLGFGAGTAAAAVSKGGVVGSTGVSSSPDILNVHNRQNCPIDLCNGVILHVFVDAPQNLKSGSHDSVAASSIAPAKKDSNNELITVPPRMDAEWTEQLALRFAEKSLTVNLWAVTSYEGQDIGLSTMDSLAHLTGGSINRIVLGWYPKDERERLTESLRRTLNAMQATRCLLKLRASPMIEFIEQDATGTFLADKNLPGVYRIGSCTPEKAFGFPFAYKVNSQVGHPGDKDQQGNTVAIQLAFSYETLIEGDKGLLVRECERKEPSNELLEGFMDSALNILELGEIKKAVAQFAPDVATKTNRRRFAPRGYRSPATASAAAGGAEGGADEVIRDCPYDRSRQLMAVKYLRIVTILVECTTKPIRLFQSCHMPTVLALNARLAYSANRRFFLQENAIQAKHDVTQAASSLPAANKLNVENAGIKLMVNFTIQWLISFAKCSLASKADKSTDKLTFDQLLKLPNIDAILHELQDNEPLVHDIVLHSYSAADILDSLLLKSSYLCDELCEFNYLLQSSDAFNASRLLYPRLVPLSSSDLVLEKYSIALSRSSMLTHASSYKYFLLDAGTELIVYKSIIGGMGSTASSEEVDLMSNFRDIGGKARVVNVSGAADPVAKSNETAPKSIDEATQEILFKSSKLGFFLLNFLRRRIQCSPTVPKVYLCDAGTQSSSFFTKHLVEERCRSGLIEYRQFKELLIDIVKSSA